MKVSLLEQLYRKLDPHATPEKRTEEEIREADEALEVLRRYQLKLRKAGVTREEVRRWINESRA